MGERTGARAKPAIMAPRQCWCASLCQFVVNSLTGRCREMQAKGSNLAARHHMPAPQCDHVPIVLKRSQVVARDKRHPFADAHVQWLVLCMQRHVPGETSHEWIREQFEGTGRLIGAPLHTMKCWPACNVSVYSTAVSASLAQDCRSSLTPGVTPPAGVTYTL